MLAIVIIGDEILSGQVVDENLPFMIQRFAAAGYPPREVRIIGDEVEGIASTVRELLSRFSYVVTAGGVGPTHDDLTHAGVAAAFGVPLEPNRDMLEFLGARHDRDHDPSVKRMAMLPRGSLVIGSDEGRWPIIRKENCFMLPGLPVALRDKIPRLIELLPELAPSWVAAVYLNAEEVLFADWLAALQSRHGAAAIGSYPVVHNSEFKTRITVTADNGDLVRELLQEIERFARRHGWFVRKDEPFRGRRPADGA